MGQQLTPDVLGILAGYNPTRIRISTGMLSCDCRAGRITVMVDNSDMIESINIEITQYLIDGSYVWICNN